MTPDALANAANAGQPSGQPTTPRIAERGVVVRGLRLATAISDATREMLARAPLVVLPAANHTWNDYLPVLERFASERRVFALDWPGFGGSAQPAPADFAYSAQGYADLLAGWMDALGIARAVLLGNAVGAAAALRYAAAQPARVAGLALVAPSGFTPPSRVRALSCRVLGSPALLRRVEPLLTSLALGPTTEQSQAINARLHAARADATSHAAALAAYAALWRSFDHPEDSATTLASQVHAPTIVLRGALDPIISAADTRAAAAALGSTGRGALEVVLPGAGHLPFLQQPERFAQALAGLLETVEANANAAAH